MSGAQLLGLLASGALVAPAQVRIVRPPVPVFSCVTFERHRAFGQQFVLSSCDGGQWALARVDPDGTEVPMGLLRDLLGWRPGGPPVGGWR